DVDEQELGIEDRDRHVLIPVSHARLDEDQKTVTVDAISSTDVPVLPPFTGDLSTDYEQPFASLAAKSERSESSRIQGESISRDVRVQQRGRTEFERESRPLDRKSRPLDRESRPVDRE